MNGEEFLGSNETQQIEQLNQSDGVRALRSMAELAMRLGLNDEQVAGVVDQLRSQLGELDHTRLEVMTRSSADLNLALGGVVLRATEQQPVEPSPVVLVPEQTSYDESEVPTATSERSSDEVVTLAQRANDLVDLMFGTDDARQVRTGDIDKIADLALQLRARAGNRMTPERTDQLRQMVVGVLEGKRNAEIAEALNKKSADINSGLMLLRGTFAKIPNLQQLAVQLWQGSEPEVADDVSAATSNSRLRYLSTQAPIEAVDSVEVIERPATGPGEDFQRLQVRIGKELVSCGGDITDVPATFDELSQSIQKAYNGRFSDAERDDGSPLNKRFIEFYLSYLNGQGRVGDLLAEYEVTSGHFQRVSQILPALIAAELLQSDESTMTTQPVAAVEPEQPVVSAVPVATPSMMPQKQELSFTPPAHKKPTIYDQVVQQSTVEQVEVPSESEAETDNGTEVIVYEPAVQDLIIAAVNPDSSTAKRWYQDSYAFIESQSKLLTVEQRQALWDGIRSDHKKVNLGKPLNSDASDARQLLAQSRPELEMIESISSREIADAIAHITDSAGTGLRDFTTIHEELGRKHKATAHDVERYMGAAFAVLCAHAQVAN